MGELQQRLFASYKEVHGDFLEDEDVRRREAFFSRLFRCNYAPLFSSKDAAVLEIGCGKGYFLKVLRDHGLHSLQGVDLSPNDLDFAREKFGLTNTVVSDARPFLQEHPETFDIIFSKDVMEHVEKGELAALVAAMDEAVKPGGLVILQVPNMDWAASPHERYMDLTHEIGFTRESLGQLMRLHFDQVEIRKVSCLGDTWKQRLLRLIRPAYLALYRCHLKVLGEGAADVWFDVREIAAVCRKGC